MSKSTDRPAMDPIEANRLPDTALGKGVRSIFLNIRVEATDEREDGLYLTCPFCDTETRTDELFCHGCECGATTTTHAVFRRGGEDGGE